MSSSATVLAPSPSLILWPGFLTLPKGCERYVVEAPGSIIVEVEAGDRVEIIDKQGGQPCEIIGIGKEGRFDQSVLSLNPDCKAEGFKALLTSGDESVTRAKKSLQRRNIDISDANATRVFSALSPAGDKADFTIENDGILIIAAIGDPMDPGEQNTLTPVEVFIYRATIRTGEKATLPEPLADPVQDIRVAMATSEAFTVKAGEYIQIIDVEGRQCSDFQAFSQRKLDNGNQSALDATITRTLLGLVNPVPGLPGKAFDREMEPLVEVIQDTCGRHDVFMTACNSKYYDEMGYPGHVNCSDNFNRSLDPYGINARKGWEALNYFYNTGIDAANQVYFDEPWSRPGDYVLMRAITDLVCVVSACPCDIDAANGWNPTDIHVRVYASDETFQRATAFRMTPDADPVLTKQTAFHASFAEYTRDFVEYNGYWLPQSFNRGGATKEYWAAREKAVIMDLSPLRKFEVTGPDAEALLQYGLTRNVRKLNDGQVVYSAMCYEHGGMVDDGTLFRLAKDNFRWIGGSDVSGKWLREKAEELGLKAWVRSSTDQLHNVAVQGPNSRDILKEIVWTPPTRMTLEELQWFQFTVGRIGDFQGVPIVVSRTGYSGELGYEVFCHPKDAKTVFDAIWAAGEPHGLEPLGLEALDMLRIEAGLIFKDYEFDDTTDPFEAGIGFTVPLKSKEDNFIGKAALIDRKAHPRRKLVGLEIQSEVEVSKGDCIHIGRAQIGDVTSSVRSPVLKKNIALARVDVVHSALGTEVEIGKLDGHMKRLPAIVVGFPHYDPEKKKPRS